MLKKVKNYLVQPVKNLKGGDSEVDIGKKTWSLGTFAVYIIVGAIVIGAAIVLFNTFFSDSNGAFKELQNATKTDPDIPTPKGN